MEKTRHDLELICSKTRFRSRAVLGRIIGLMILPVDSDLGFVLVIFFRYFRKLKINFWTTFEKGSELGQISLRLGIMQLLEPCARLSD